MNSGETVQEFIAKLPKGNMFTRQSNRRLSLLRTTTDSHLKTVMEDTAAKPLMDLGNQNGKQEKKIETSGSDRTLYFKNSCKKSTLLKEFHELRKSRISTSLTNGRLNVATPSQNNPILLSARKGTPLISSRRKATSREKSPAFCHTNIENSPKVTVIKRFNLRSSSCKKVSVHSSGKKGVFHRRNEIAKIQMKETIEKKGLDQDCRRALWFSEDENEEAEKENMKPLPALQLSSSKISGSMLRRRSTITVRPHCSILNKPNSDSNSIQKVSQFNENYMISKEPKNKEKAINNKTLSRRYSSIPSINKSKITANKQRRRSEMVPSIDIQKENGLSPISEKSTSDGSGFKRQFSKRTSLIPTVDRRKRTSLIPLVDERNQKNPQKFLTLPPNDSSDSNIDKRIEKEGMLKESVIIDKNDFYNEICLKCSSRVVKDSETNTTDLNEAHQQYLKEMETKMEKALSDQLRLEKEFQVITVEFFQKGKTIMQEYKNTFNYMNELVSEFKHVLTLPVISTQMDKRKIEGVKSEPVSHTASKISKREYRFLGTPLPKKNKKLIHSFSDPPTPSPKSPTSHEASFHSVDSVISPFTNIVGDLERPSLLPMTPGSRSNFTVLKSSLNEQLEILFKEI